MQTGIPRQPAANVAKLAPGFEPSFSWLAFLAAALATLAWAWLVKWRAGRQRAAVWKSLVLPAGGA
ncbi:glycosyltransferase, partial [Neisseria gonorrhoeae]